MTLDPTTVALLAAASSAVAALMASRMISMDLIFLNTRYNVIGNPNVSSRRLIEALAVGSAREAMRHLDGRYFPVGEADSPREAERNVRMVNRGFVAEAFERVPAGAKPFYAVLLMAHEVDEVRLACAAIRRGRRPEIAPIGRIDGTVATRIAMAATPGEAVGTYLEAIGRATAGEPTEADLENARVWGSSDALDALRGLHGRPLRRVLRTMLDADLVLLALRAGIHGGASTRDLDLPEGYEVSTWMLGSICDDPAAGLRALEGTALAVAADAVDPVLAEAMLRRAVMEQLDTLYGSKFLSVGPLTRFLVLREFEAANVRAVILAAEAGMRWEDISQVVTTEAAA
ncbi:MAG: V-type ATPase subunit [Thermoplasmata archaeon]|nr:V-type ATPase subunit [Thermoplasmata archaeon]